MFESFCFFYPMALFPAMSCNSYLSVRCDLMFQICYFKNSSCCAQCILYHSHYNYTLYDLKRKIRTRTEIRTTDLRISSPALYHLSYPGSHASSCSNLPLQTEVITTNTINSGLFWAILFFFKILSDRCFHIAVVTETEMTFSNLRTSLG